MDLIGCRVPGRIGLFGERAVDRIAECGDPADHGIDHRDDRQCCAHRSLLLLRRLSLFLGGRLGVIDAQAGQRQRLNGDIAHSYFLVSSTTASKAPPIIIMEDEDRPPLAAAAAAACVAGMVCGVTIGIVWPVAALKALASCVAVVWF